MELLTFIVVVGAVILIIVDRVKNSKNASSNRVPQTFTERVVDTNPPQNGQANIPALSQAALAKGMALKLKRSESRTAFDKPIFRLDARLEVSPQIRDHIQKYRLGNEVIYESSSREKHRDAALAHLDDSRDNTSIFAPAGEQMKGVARTFWQLGKAGARMAMASLSLRLTISSLIAGVHVECKDMDELLDAEVQITEAARNLKSYLTAATSFDGQEQIVEI